MTKRTRRTHHVHDLSWRDLLRHPTAIHRLVENYLPDLTPLLKDFEFEKAEVVPGSFIERPLREIESDVIWKIPLAGNRDFVVYVLIEHQSTSCYSMVLRMLRYVVGLYGELQRRWEEKASVFTRDSFPMVVPVVLYCGVNAWDAPCRFQELLPERLHMEPPFVELRYLLIDVNRLDVTKLLEFRDALSGLFVLEKGRLTKEPELIDKAAECFAAEQDRSFLEAVLKTAYTILSERGERGSPEKIKAWLRAHEAKDREMVMTMREYLMWAGKEHWLKEGLEKGLEKGREEGREEALTSNLSVLRKAFARRGVDPAEYEQELQAFTVPGDLVELVAEFVAAEDPHAYLRGRFGH